MGRYLVWYKLQLKAWLKQRSCVIQLIGMAVLVWLLSNISFPQTECNFIGVCNVQGKAAEAVFCDLKTKDSVFEFCEYTNSEDLKKDLLAGKVKAGFVFCEDFQCRWDKGVLNKTVQYITTPYGSRGLIAKETFFTSVFKVYSEEILLQGQKELYTQESLERTEYLLEKNQEYLQGEELFQMQIEVLPREKKVVKDLTKLFPIQGIIGILIFVIIWMEQGRKKFTKKKSLELVLNSPEKFLYEYVHCVAVGTPAAVEGLFLVVSNTESRGILKELSGMFGLLFLCSLWVMIVAKTLKKATTFASWTMVLVLIQLVIYPIFTDISKYILAIKYVRYVFPINIYMQI